MPRYLAFHKPYEVLSQFTDSENRATLKDFISIPGIYAAGRLDYRSEGLLLLTDDGELIHRLTDPKFGHERIYWAQVEGLVTELAVQALASQIVLPAIQTRLPAVRVMDDPGFSPRSKPVRNYHPTSWLEITLQEGKKHQVRRMTAAVGFPTLRLVRVAIGSLKLAGLRPGEWRQLTFGEVQDLRKSLHLEAGIKH